MESPVVSVEPNLQAITQLTTRDGRAVRVRHLRSDDAGRLEGMFYRLSSESRYRRFFVPLDHIDYRRVIEEARRLSTVHPEREVALVAVTDEDGAEEALGVARFTSLPHSAACAEASIVVRDDYHGSGLGSQLFDLLVQSALVRGIRHLVFLTHADNLGMIGLVQRSGLPFKGHYAAGLYEIDMQLADGEAPFFPFSSGEA